MTNPFSGINDTKARGAYRGHQGRGGSGATCGAREKKTEKGGNSERRGDQSGKKKSMVITGRKKGLALGLNALRGPPLKSRTSFGGREEAELPVQRRRKLG